MIFAFYAGALADPTFLVLTFLCILSLSYSLLQFLVKYLILYVIG